MAGPAAWLHCRPIASVESRRRSYIYTQSAEENWAAEHSINFN